MKRIKQLFVMIFITFLIISGVTPIAFAESQSTDDATSEASVKFIEGDTPPPIVDPTDPTEPYDPDPNDPSEPQDPPTDNTGSLTLDYVSSVHFGTQEIGGSTMTYESTVLTPFIQVSDRRGTGAGWTVTAEASNFLNEETGDTTLPGSLLTFTNGEVVSPNDNLIAPTSNDSVVLYTGGDAATVVTAAPETGLGTWVNRWFPEVAEADKNDNVTLTIPGGTATVGNHTATITWTLTDAPGQ